MRAKTVARPELLVDGDDVVFRTFVHDFLAFSQMLTEIRSAFGEHIGLTGVQYSILMSVSHKQGRTGVGINAIAEHLHLSGAFVTTEASKLVAAGYIKKRVNAKDKRRVLLTLTAEGRKLLNQLVTLQAPVNDTLFETVSAAEFLPLQEMIARLIPCASRSLALIKYLTTAVPEPVSSRARA